MVAKVPTVLLCKIVACVNRITAEPGRTAYERRRMAAHKVTAAHRRWDLLPSGPEPTQRDRGGSFSFSAADLGSLLELRPSVLRCVLAQALKAVEQGALGFIDLIAGRCQVEPFRAIDFGKSLLAAASWRPFDLESVALNCPHIQVEIGGESLDDLAAALSNLAQGGKRHRQFNTEFFSKFPSSRAFCHFVSGKFAFRNRPRTEVLFPPKQSSRMNQKYLNPASVPSEREDACASRGHDRYEPKRSIFLVCAISRSQPKTDRPSRSGEASRSLAMKDSSDGPCAVRSSRRAWSSRRFTACISSSRPSLA